MLMRICLLKETRMKVDVDKLKMREILDIEEKAGMNIAEVFRTESMRGFAALVWVVRRRENPEFSWDAALDLDFNTAHGVLDKAASNGLGTDGEDDAADPTEPTGDELGST
jgi:hypothetical protein